MTSSHSSSSSFPPPIPTPPLVYLLPPPKQHSCLEDLSFEHTPALPSHSVKVLLAHHCQHVHDVGQWIHLTHNCREWARQMGLPTASKQRWWDFCHATQDYLSQMESRILFLVEVLHGRGVLKVKHTTTTIATNEVHRTRGHNELVATSTVGEMIQAGSRKRPRTA